MNEILKVKEELKVLVSEEQIQNRILELAEEINRDFEGEELILVCLLKGAVMFYTDLAKRLTMDVKLAFLDVSSYGHGEVSTGVVNIKKDLENSVVGKNVLLVDDIIDSGYSMDTVINHMKAKKPAVLKTCVLLDKPERREVKHLKMDYVGFEIENKFLIGYGLDYKGSLRNVPYVGYKE